ncbi:MAG TPA: hypothetical protein VK530_16190, partial [Candidatus Acidoferrum sp.]|nr:hypothetical protein [Candidatus Acidoferrum sp.]
MKKNFPAGAMVAGVIIALVGLTQSFADPVLPYSAPIAERLSNDVATLQAIPNRTPAQNKELNRDNAALRAYHRSSTALKNDISILKSLHELLVRIHFLGLVTFP